MATKNPAIEALTQAATTYATARAGQVIDKAGKRASGKTGSTDSTGGTEEKGDASKGFVGAATEKLAEGASPIGAAVKGVGTAVKEKVTGLFKRKGGAKRPTNIVEDVWIGAPIEVVFEAFTTWEEFPSFMKGPESVTRGDTDEEAEDSEPEEGEETTWTAKIFLNRRSWKATTVDYDPPNRISWTSEGAKGTVDGTITFTEMGDDLTLLLATLEYRPKGFFEWWGNRWRTVGRRVRLDLKHFRRYVMRTEPDDLPEPEEPEEPTDSEETPQAPEEGPEEQQ